MELRKLKRVVVKEELVALTGDCYSSIILNQFLYWAERRRDYDKFIREENEIARKQGASDAPLSNGWIYKKTEELAEEIMIPISRQVIRRHIKALVEAGYVSERRNPIDKWDYTLQYRVNLNVIARALNELGYSLEGHVNFAKPMKISDNQNGLPDVNNVHPEVKIEPPSSENTTETPTEITAVEDKFDINNLNNVDNYYLPMREPAYNDYAYPNISNNDMNTEKYPFP